MPFAALATDLPEINVLTENDAILYKQIFMLQAEEEISAAQKLEKQLTDNILMNEVLYQRFYIQNISYTWRGISIMDE